MPRVRKKTGRTWRSEARSDPEALRIIATLGNRIRALRSNREMTQEDLAERAALSVQHLLDLEHGRSNPTVTSLIGIARGLDVPIRDLFG